MTSGVGERGWCSKTQCYQSESQPYILLRMEQERKSPASCGVAAGASPVEDICGGVFHCTQCGFRRNAFNFDVNVLLRKVYKPTYVHKAR